MKPSLRKIQRFNGQRNIHVFKDEFHQYSYLWLHMVTFDDVVQEYAKESHVAGPVSELDALEWGIRCGLMSLMNEKETAQYVRGRAYVSKELTCKHVSFGP